MPTTTRRIAATAHHRSPVGFVRAVLVTAMLATGFRAGARGAERLSEEEAHAIGVKAYLYVYSLVTVDLTRKQLTNVERPEGFHAPMNAFASLGEYPPAEMKVVVRPNFDTLYMLPMLDMWTDVFASPGWRTTGT
jgi:hypothetical protein